METPRGKHVYLRHPAAGDRAEFIAAVRHSVKLHASWVALSRTAAEYAGYLKRAQREDVCAWLVFTRENDGLAGGINLSQIFHGRFKNAYLGFFAFEGYAGRGLMREGVLLALRHAFNVLKLHRVEANINPENVRSKRLVERVGFACEGYSPKFLKIGGRWQDHERWAMRAEMLRKAKSE